MMEEDSTEGDEGQPKPKKKARMQDNNDSDGSDVDVDMPNEGGDPESEEEAELPKSTRREYYIVFFIVIVVILTRLLAARPKPAYGKYAKASASLNAPEEAIAQNLGARSLMHRTRRLIFVCTQLDSDSLQARPHGNRSVVQRRTAKSLEVCIIMLQLQMVQGEGKN